MQSNPDSSDDRRERRADTQPYRKPFYRFRDATLVAESVSRVGASGKCSWTLLIALALFDRSGFKNLRDSFSRAAAHRAILCKP
jgi:hypothetical protein